MINPQRYRHRVSFDHDLSSDSKFFYFKRAIMYVGMEGQQILSDNH
jgi:hypothetical protein